MGVTRLYSYHVPDYVRDGRLRIILHYAEPPALPVHILTPRGRATVAALQPEGFPVTPKSNGAEGKGEVSCLGWDRSEPL